MISLNDILWGIGVVVVIYAIGAVISEIHMWWLRRRGKDE